MCDPWTYPPLERTDRRPATVHEPFSVTETPVTEQAVMYVAEPNERNKNTTEHDTMKKLNVLK